MNIHIDVETERAIAALVHRLRTRGSELDDEALAREFVIALRDQGWRPTAAKPLPTWQQQRQQRSKSAPPSAEYRRIRAALTGRRSKPTHTREEL